LAAERLAGDEMHVSTVPYSDGTQVAFAYRTDRTDGVELQQRGHLLALLQSAAFLHRHLVDDAIKGCVYAEAIEIGLRLAHRRAGAGESRARCIKLQRGDVAALGEALGRGSFGLSLGQRLACRLHGRFLSFRFELYNEITFLDPRTLAYGQFFDNARLACGEGSALVGLGVAGDAHDARMLEPLRLRHLDGL